MDLLDSWEGVLLDAELVPKLALAAGGKSLDPLLFLPTAATADASFFFIALLVLIPEGIPPGAEARPASLAFLLLEESELGLHLHDS